MRTIKFRGYSKSYKTWHYGSLELAKGGKCFIKSFYDNGAVARTRVDEESVGQFTGGYDHEGNPVYEGDILEDSEGIHFIIHWSDEGYYYIDAKLGDDKFIMLPPGEYDYKDFKVIHNVYSWERKI